MPRALRGRGAGRDPSLAQARVTAWGRGSWQQEGVPEGTTVSPELELVRGLLAGSRPPAQGWHWGFFKHFYPISTGSGARGCRGASCFQERCSVTGYPRA